MSYQLLIEKDRPIVYKTFDDATNKTHQLVAGLGKAALVTTTAFTHQFDQWTQGPFTVEIWFKAISNNDVTIFGHDEDGLVYSPATREVSFTVEQADGTLVTTKQYIDDVVMQLVAKYTGYSIELLVNGYQSSELVAQPLKITGTLKTGGGKMAVDALSCYNYVLSDDILYQHYLAGTSFPNLGQVYANADNYFALTDDRADILGIFDFSGWQNVYTEACYVDDGQVLPFEDYGYVYANVLLPDDIELHGGKIRFDYQGPAPVVESSLDGLTWVPVENNSKLNQIPVGQTLPDADLMVRIRIEQGTALTGLHIVIYQDNQNIGTKESSIVNLDSNAFPGEVEFNTQQQNMNAGAKGGLQLEKLTDDPIVGVSYWYLGPERPGVKNGSLGHITDQWNFTYENVSSLNIDDYEGRIANLAVWDTNQDVQALYDRHFTYQGIFVQSDDQIEVYEPANGVKLYQNTWIVL